MLKTVKPRSPSQSPKPQAPSPKPQTPNATAQTPGPKPQALILLGVMMMRAMTVINIAIILVTRAIIIVVAIY